MTTCDVLIVGGGPAGLRAAELVSAAGLRTVLADHKPSVGRKFLVAGRGGLNLTHSEPIEFFSARYGNSSQRWNELLAEFSPSDLRAWAKDLGIETFIGTSGRVFPESKQAAPLLRRWIERLRKQGVSFRPRHELMTFRQISEVAAAIPARSANISGPPIRMGREPIPSDGAFLAGPSASRDWLPSHSNENPGNMGASRRNCGGYLVTFSTPEGDSTFQTRAVIFALGGASWPQTGSDGNWTQLFSEAGVNVAPLTPANCGYEVAWPESFLAQAEGLPLKNIVVHAEGESVAGELLITKYGLEGGAIYQLGRSLRSMSSPRITINLKPSLAPDQMLPKLAAATGKQSLVERAARAWKLSPVAKALLETHPLFTSPEEIASTTQAFPLTLRGPRPIAEAISSAGGIRWNELNDNLMLLRHPGLFCAGEMIDWDAPTGGYLLQGCFSTATCAAKGTLNFLTELTGFSPN